MSFVEPLACVPTYRNTLRLLCPVERITVTQVETLCTISHHQTQQGDEVDGPRFRSWGDFPWHLAQWLQGDVSPALVAQALRGLSHLLPQALPYQSIETRDAFRLFISYHL